MSARAQALKASLVLVAVFAAGLGAGVGLDRWISPRQGSARVAPPLVGHLFVPVEQLQQRLQLSADQATRIQAIMEAQSQQMEALRSAHRPRMLALYDEGRARVRAELTPEQAQQFDALMQEQGLQRPGHGPGRGSGPRDGRGPWWQRSPASAPRPGP